MRHWSPAEARHANNCQPRWLYNFAHHRWYWQPPESRPVANTSPNSSSCATFWTRNRHCTICCPTSVTSTLWTDFAMQKTFELSQTRTERFKKIVHPIQSCTFPIAFTVAIRCLIDYLFYHDIVFLALFLIVHNPADAATPSHLISQMAE